MRAQPGPGPDFQGPKPQWRAQRPVVLATSRDPIGLVGPQAPLGMHVYCRFVEYTDATFQSIAAVSNVTDTLVVP